MPRPRIALKLDNRRTFTLKLTPGKHDDLIDWLESIDGGQRHEMMIMALERFASEVEAGRVVASDRVGQIQEDVSTLKSAVAYLTRVLEEKLSGATFNLADYTPELLIEEVGVLTAAEIEAREANMAKVRW
jgi:hypothetical protein